MTDEKNETFIGGKVVPDGSLTSRACTDCNAVQCGVCMCVCVWIFIHSFLPMSNACSIVEGRSIDRVRMFKIFHGIYIFLPAVIIIAYDLKGICYRINLIFCRCELSLST